MGVEPLRSSETEKMFGKLNSKSSASVVCIGALLAMTPSWLYGQASTATIVGTVSDASGATIVGAMVQVRNVGTGVVQNTVSDAQGRYRVPNLNIGEYEVRVSNTGFQTVVHGGI